MTSNDKPAAAGKPNLAVRIDQEKSHPLAWKTVAKRAAVVAVAGLAIYLVFPAITEVFASWPRLTTLNPWWLTAAIAAEIAHFACTFALQRLALRTKPWFPVITSTLAGNAISLIMPGGAAVGAATQFRMLAVSGMDTSSTVGGLAAFSLLGVGGLLALPLFALPVILIGAPVNRGLENAAFLGAAGFVAFAAFGAVVLVYDAPLRWAGRTAQRLRNMDLAETPPAGRAGRAPCSPSATTSGRYSAGSGGRRCCCRPAAWRWTTCACCSRCGPPGATRAPRWSWWPTRWPASSG